MGGSTSWVIGALAFSCGCSCDFLGEANTPLVESRLLIDAEHSTGLLGMSSTDSSLPHLKALNSLQAKLDGIYQTILF
jgi:hypothetical protein